MSSLLTNLNRLTDKSPDEVVAALTNPFARWKQMSKVFTSEDHWRKHRHDFVLLYNSTRRHYHGRVDDFHQSTALRVNNWGYSTWRSPGTNEWYVIGADFGTPFIQGVHDVFD